MNSVYLLLAIVVTVVIGDSLLPLEPLEPLDNTTTTIGARLQIFANLAEISKPISLFDLPITFSQQEWYDIRPDSIRLIGDYLKVTSQTILFNRTTLNGQKILIKRDADSERYTEAIMIDEGRNLIQDLIDNSFYIVTNDRIRYLSIPPINNYTVDFTYETSSVEQVYLRFLQSNLKWTVRYDLFLEGNDTDSILQAYADIRNDGSAKLYVEQAELISGDVRIETTSSSSYPNGGSGYPSYSPIYGANVNGDQQSANFNSAPTVSNAQELAGVYTFLINDSFVLAPTSNYILPMFRPTIDIERYGSIVKYFSRSDDRGNAQRGYRLRVPDTFSPKGQVFVREMDRLVGELRWPDRAANETYEFYLGDDPDLQYIEWLQLNSRRIAYEANGYKTTVSKYTIDLRLINNKPRPMSIEYRLRFNTVDSLDLKENTTNGLLRVEGSNIVGSFELNANDDQEYKFTFETQ